MIPLYKSYSDESDIQAVSEVIRSQMHWAEGPNIDLFEARLCEYLGVPGALVCNSGTSALHMAMITCVKRLPYPNPIPEVIVPSFTFIATVNAIRFVGAHPVFADIEEETFGLDPEDVERKITPKTKAIIAIHYGGQPCKIKELRKIALRHNLMLIEDACESLGAKVDGIPVGTLGDCGVFSFCANKIISTGEGGAFVTSNKFLYDRAKLIRSHGRLEDKFVTLGYNFRMPDMNAALGASQLAKIERIIAARRQIAKWYEKYLDVPFRESSVYQLFTMRIPDGKRDVVMRHLQESDIGCKVYFQPVHLTDYYQRYSWQTVSLPVTEKISSEVLSLPIYPGLTESEVGLISEKVKEVL